MARIYKENWNCVYVCVLHWNGKNSQIKIQQPWRIVIPTFQYVDSVQMDPHKPAYSILRVHIYLLQIPKLLSHIH